MKADAIAQAKFRLGRAEKALAALGVSKAIDDAEAAWTDFLIAAATIYSKLEQGAKGSGKCEGWFGRKKKARKDDQLLRYLHFARNSNEHGIERVVATSAANFHRGRQLGFNERIPVKIHAVDQATMVANYWPGCGGRDRWAHNSPNPGARPSL